jgi:hypothetical protein
MGSAITACVNYIIYQALREAAAPSHNRLNCGSGLAGRSKSITAREDCRDRSGRGALFCRNDCCDYRGLRSGQAPSEGRLLIAGHDPVKEPLLVRRAFGIVFQDPSLDDERRSLS